MPFASVLALVVLFTFASGLSATFDDLINKDSPEYKEITASSSSEAGIDDTGDDKVEKISYGIDDNTDDVENEVDSIDDEANDKSDTEGEDEYTVSSYPSPSPKPDASTKTKIEDFEPITNSTLTDVATQGPMFGIKMYFGNATSGPQDDPGLINEKGKQSEGDRTEFHLSLKHYLNNFFGLEFGAGYLGGNVVAPETESMSFTSGWSTLLGISIAPVLTQFNDEHFQLAISAGLNYTALKLHTEYINFVESHAGVDLFRSTASGYGYYGAIDGRFIRENGFFTEFGFKFSNENPKFPETTQVFWANTLTLSIGLGYKPNL
jgi:hypothetical protein